MAAQKTWIPIWPLFKWEFAFLYDNKLIVDGLANLAHRQGENPCKFMSRLKKLFNVLHENYALYRVKLERPTQLPAGNYEDDTLTKFANYSIKAYNKFLLAQNFWATAPENVRKLLSHKDQTRLMVDAAYQTFFMEHSVEADKIQNMINVVNSANDDDQDNSAPDQVTAAAVAWMQRHIQATTAAATQQQFQQQGSNFWSNQSKGRSNNNKKGKPAAQYQNSQQQGSNTSRNGKFCGYCKILNHTQGWGGYLYKWLLIYYKGGGYWYNINTFV